MSVLDLPVFTAIKHKMLWHQARQTLLAENVANSETEGFRARDLQPFDFAAQLRAVDSGSMGAAATAPGHFSPASGAGSAFEIANRDEPLVLEDEMMRVTANQLDYQAATTLYARSLKLIRTALGRS